MGELKTKVTDANVEDFINKIEHEGKREDAFIVLKMLKKITKEEPKLWGASIIGFGTYHYVSERSTQEGDWPLIAFSPRKTKLSIYIMDGYKNKQALLKKLGKHKTGVSCLYINKLADVDLKVLEELMKKSFDHMKKNYK